MEVPDLYRKLCIPEPIKAKLTEEEIRHLDAEARKMMWAAFIDAEGCIRMACTLKGLSLLSKKGPYPVVTLAQVTPAYCQLLAEEYGGKISKYPVKSKTGKARDSFQWRRTGRTARRILSDIVPYLRDKQRQGRLALEAISLLGCRGFGAGGRLHIPSEESLARRREIYYECKKLNARGRAAA